MLQSCESCVSLVSSELTEISTVSPISSDYFGFSSALDSTITAASETNTITNKTELENAAGSLCAKTQLMPVSDKRTSRCSSPGKLGYSVGIAIQNSATCNFRQLQPINSNLDIFDFIDIDNKPQDSRQYKITDEMNDFTTFDPFPSNNTGSKLKYSNKRASLPVSKQDFSFFLPEVDIHNNDNIIDNNRSKSSTTLEEPESQDSKHNNTTVKKFRARRRSINFSLPLSKQTVLSGYASTEQDHEYQNLVQSIDLKQLVKAHEEAKTSEGYIKLTALENTQKNQNSPAQDDFKLFDKNSKENSQPNVTISPATYNEKVGTAKLGSTKVLKQHCSVDLQKKFPFGEPETCLSGQNTRSILGVKQKNNKEPSHNRSLTDFQPPKNNTRRYVYQSNTAFGKTNDNTINTKKSGHFFESLPLASPQTNNYNNENEVDELKKTKKQQANKTVESCKRRFSISFKRFNLLKGMSGSIKRKTETVTE